ELDLIDRIVHLGGERSGGRRGLGPLAGLLAQAQAAVERRRKVGQRRQRVAVGGVRLVESLTLLEQHAGGREQERAAGRVAQHAGAGGGDGGQPRVVFQPGQTSGQPVECLRLVGVAQGGRVGLGRVVGAAAAVLDGGGAQAEERGGQARVPGRTGRHLQPPDRVT